MDLDLKVYPDVLTPNVYTQTKLFLQSSQPKWTTLINTAEAGDANPKYPYNSYGFAWSVLDTTLDNQGKVIDVRRDDSFLNAFLTIYFMQLDRMGLDAANYDPLRIRIGLLTHQGTQVVHDPHVDYLAPHRTMLTYFTTEEGTGHTHFYKGSRKNPELVLKNEPRENTMVEFDGSILHSSSSPMQNPFRYAVNINYREIK